MIKAVLWDVYGTLFKSTLMDFSDIWTKKKELLQRYRKVSDRLNLKVIAEEFIHTLAEEIKKVHLHKKGKGIKHPEVVIEELYSRILNCTVEEAKEVALHAEKEINNPKLLSDLVPILKFIRQKGKKQGIISNAQFYTPIELEEQLAKYKLKVEDIFDKDIIFYSYVYGVSKPSPYMFNLAKKKLIPIRPDEILYVGNDYVNDVKSSHKAGMKAALLAINKEAIRHFDESIKPDYKITRAAQMKSIVA
jgi:putative hydrolase of the HAD superfamily